ncbi:VanZ family protein [Longispora albida]|uniref:VanZ family protein n=1 Tax=Longispora albida TaxID=203523 RepID=UPI0012F7BB31|nr:VanZ family protein [Longispora albida]
MAETWRVWGGVILASVALVPAGALVVWLLARRRGSWRTALCDVAMVAGTVPWLWMILTPAGHGRSVNLVPFRDLADQLGGPSPMEQIGGNLLVFAALGFCLPIRWPALTPLRVLAIAAGCSAVVEIVQYVLAIGRHSSIDDVLLNAAGAFLAACCARYVAGWRAS